jgi:hypothetical protein
VKNCEFLGRYYCKDIHVIPSTVSFLYAFIPFLENQAVENGARKENHRPDRRKCIRMFAGNGGEPAKEFVYHGQ